MKSHPYPHQTFMAQKASAILGILMLFVLSLSSGLLLAQESKNQSANQGKTIIILDASGSMWGKVSGGVKIDIAKKAIADLLPTIDPKIEVGLMAYGHRKKGDCADIELLVPPKKGNHQAILDAVNLIAPKGKTPLCDAVLAAAKMLRYEEAKASVILISDGIETCGKDPCAIGAQLAAKGINFVCHVVAFDITKEKNANLDCLSKKTGGLYLEAKDAKSLNDALSRAMKTVVQKKTTLILSGKNSAGEMLSGVNFEIYQGKASETPLLKGRGGKYRTDLKPGDYTVVGKFGKLKAEASLNVPDGEVTQKTLTFEATGLVAQAYLTKDSPALKKNLKWEVFYQSDGTKGRAVATSYHANPTFNLAPGKYILTVRYHKNTAQQEVEVTDKKGEEIKLILGAGTLAAQVRMSEKSAPLTKHLSWKLYDAQPDVEGDYHQVAYSYKPTTNMIVPSGTYLLKVTYNKATSQKEVVVKAGEKTEVMLTLGAGSVIAEAVMVEGGKPIQKGLHWEILTPKDEEGHRKKLAYSYNSQAIFKVPSGSYVLRVKKGAAVVEKEIVITSGKTIKPVLVLNAGTWKGTAYMSEASTTPALKGVAWKFYQEDAEGGRQEVAHSYGSKPPSMSLSAGSYIAVAKRGQAIAEKTITVTAGKVTSDKLVFNAGILDVSSVKGSKGSKFYADIYSVNEEGKTKVASFRANKKRYYLPAGDYLVTVTPRDKTDQAPPETKITIVAGKTQQLELK